jgi:S-adenosylmethionine:tRNA ribosyltransferase-isomerase
VRTDLFDFDLPAERIAQTPADRRDESRLMVIRRGAGGWSHHRFRELPALLEAGDLIVRNNSRVLPARVTGHRVATGGRWEGLYLHTDAQGDWIALATTRGRAQPGEVVRVGQGLELELVERLGDGRWRLRPRGSEAPAAELLQVHGTVPLPPYIRKGREGPGDRERYQTVYAQVPGSVAAPTAGLHFTPEVIAALEARGIGSVDVTLHVGIGTFRPIEVEEVEAHALHGEWAELSPATAERLNAQRAAGGRVVAVGTTAARTLETAASMGMDEAPFRPFADETALYLRPGHRFRGLDVLLTNFHLPRSSLLVLVASLAGRELVLAAYAEAVREGYRFYSYGDAMLVLP